MWITNFTFFLKMVWFAMTVCSVYFQACLVPSGASTFFNFFMFQQLSFQRKEDSINLKCYSPFGLIKSKLGQCLLLKSALSFVIETPNSLSEHSFTIHFENKGRVSMFFLFHLKGNSVF